MNPEILDRIKKLEEKYDAMGQDLSSYLDGLLYADYLTYWDYIHLDTLLSLQSPRTSFPDEKVFIIYHQITELYFNLVLHEFTQIEHESNTDVALLIKRITRINRYFESLTASFDIMVDGMDQNQFLKFRMSLLPASGFQSAQYRMIEICCTDFIQLVAKDKRSLYEGLGIRDLGLGISESPNPQSPIPNPQSPTFEQMYEDIYWKYGATELSSGKKTLTLRQFEQKYSKELIELAYKFQQKNLYAIYKSLPEVARNNEQLKQALRAMDQHINVNWPLVHFKSAVRYLDRTPDIIAATGGTNWQKYLPPRFQKRIFFPSLWTEQEIAEWGKGWVKSLGVKVD